MRLTAVTVLAVATAHPLAAQDAVRLHFAPAAGETVHRLFQAHTRITLSGPEPRVRESAHLGGMTQVVVALRPGGAVLHLAFDSLRSRARAGAGAWHERVVDPTDRLWVQVHLDRRLRRVATPGGADHPGADLLVQLVTGIADLALPDRAVAGGDRWEQQLGVPLATAPEDLPHGTAPATTRVDVTVTVDSVVPRASDTLAYLGVRGAVADDGGDEALAVGGELSGELIWSTAWRGFVAAATRTRVELAPRTAETPPRQLVIETTLRSSVRP
jgi:hypothetical protein